MATIKLKYIGLHQPQEEIEVDEEKANVLLKQGGYMLIEDCSGTIEEVIDKRPSETKKPLKSKKNKNKR